LSSQEDYSKEPTTTARVEYDEATKQQALERAKLPETIPDDKILQQRQLEASYSRLRAPSPSAVAEVDKYISYIEEQKTAKKKLAQIESSLPELKTKAEAEAKYETEYLAKKELAIEEAWLSKKRQELIQINLSRGKGSPEMYKSVEGSISELRKRNEEAQAKLKSATTQSEIKSIAWNYKDTMYGWEAFESTAGRDALQAYYKYVDYVNMMSKGGGKWDNTILGRAQYIYFGGTSEEYSKIVEADRRNIEASRIASAGLRASGNAQIQQAQTLELQRLGGTGDLVSGAGFGATSVSQTLTVNTNVADRVSVVQGVAPLNEPWAKGFTPETAMFGFKTTGSAEQARLNQITNYNNQKYFESQGLGDWYKQQLEAPVSNVFNADPTKDWTGSLDTEINRQTNSVPLTSLPQIQKVETQNPVQGLKVNQDIISSNKQAQAQQKQQIREMSNLQKTTRVITLSTPLTNPTIQGNFISGLDPRRYTDKSLMGTKVKATSTDPNTQLKNIQQRQYTAELRAGNIGLATALLNPQTTQTYQVKGKTVPREATSINAESYFQQLGYDTKKSDLIPNSVFKPVKFEEARLQASKAEKTGATMGDLTKLIPTAPQATPETVRQRKEAQIRVIKAGQPVVTAPKEYNSDKTLIGTGVVNLVKKTQTTTVGASEEALTVPTEKKNVFEFDPIAVQVGKTQKYQFGEGETAKEFSTLAEAQSYARGLEPKVYEGNIFNKFLRTGEAIDLGEIDKARTPEQQVAEVVSRATMPIRNITYEVMNLTRPEEEKIKIVQTGFGTLVGETIDSAITGKPLDTGVRKTIEYYTEKPIRIVEAPAEIATFVAGGRAIQGVAKGGIILKEVAKQSPKIPQVIKTGIFTGEKVASKVQTVPSKVTQSVESYYTPYKIQYPFTEPTPAKLNPMQKLVKSIDFTLNKIEGSRVGLGAKLELTATLSGRRFVKETKGLAQEVGGSKTILSRNVALIESPELTIIKARRGLQEVPKELPKEKPFGFEPIPTTPKTKLIPKEGVPKSPTELQTEKTGILKTIRQKIKLGKTKEPTTTPELTIEQLPITQETITKAVIQKYFPELIKQKPVKGVTTKEQKLLEKYELSARQETEKFGVAKSLSQRIKFIKPKKLTGKEETLTVYAVTPEEKIPIIARPLETKIVGEISPKVVKEGKLVDQFRKAEFVQIREKEIPFKTATSTPTGKPISGTTLTRSEIENFKKIGIEIKAKPIEEASLIEKQSFVSGIREKQIIPTEVRFPTKSNISTLEKLEETGQIERIGKRTILTKEELKQFPQAIEKTTLPYQTELGITKTGERIATREADVFELKKKQLSITNPFKKTMKESILLKEIGKRQKEIQKIVGSYTPPTRPISKTPEGLKVYESGKMPVEIQSKKRVKQVLKKGKTYSGVSPIKEVAKKEAEALAKKKTTSSPRSGYIISSAVVGTAYIDTTPAGATPFTPPQLTNPTKSIEIPSTITSVRETPAVKTSSGVIPLTATKTLTSTRQVVKEKLETSQVPKLETKVSTTQVQIPITITTPKLAVKQTARLSLKQAQAFAKPTPTLQRFKRPIIGGIYIPKAELESQLKKKVKKGEKADFIGNVRLDSIYNVYKRRDITYGASKVAKLEKQDKLVSKRVPNMLTSATPEMKKKSGTKKKKSETILGFEFTKTKDEFNSFGSSLTGSKKGKKGKKDKKTKIRLI